MRNRFELIDRLMEHPLSRSWEGWDIHGRTVLIKLFPGFTKPGRKRAGFTILVLFGHDEFELTRYTHNDAIETAISLKKILCGGIDKSECGEDYYDWRRDCDD